MADVSKINGYDVKDANAVFINARANLADGGLVTGTNVYRKGASCTLTATANSDYTFLKWIVTGTSTQLSSNATYTFTVQNSIDITAVFMENTFEIVTWADGTDAQIAAMVQAADDGYITLSDYWSVGDTRIVSLSAMAADSTAGYEAHAAQTVQLSLMEYASCTGITLVSTGEKPNFIVGQKNCLEEGGRMNTGDTSSGGWGACMRRAWCNAVYKAAIPSTLLGIFKRFSWSCVTSGGGSTLETIQDYFALPPERAIVASRGNSTETEWALFNQWSYYLTSSNRVKLLGTAGSAVSWKICSPSKQNSQWWAYIESDGAARYAGNGPDGIAPFGCI